MQTARGALRVAPRATAPPRRIVSRPPAGATSARRPVWPRPRASPPCCLHSRPLSHRRPNLLTRPGPGRAVSATTSEVAPPPGSFVLAVAEAEHVGPHASDLFLAHP